MPEGWATGLPPLARTDGEPPAGPDEVAPEPDARERVRADGRSLADAMRRLRDALDKAIPVVAAEEERRNSPRDS